MGVGILIGKTFPDAIGIIRDLEFGEGSRINIPIAVLIWLMIYPMMLKVDFGSIAHIGRKPKGLMVTLFVNWLVKPFSMAFLGWLFFKHLFLPWIGPALADQYVAGVIILAAAPCTAMVFVWSYLTDGDPAYTLVQVAERPHHAGRLRADRDVPLWRGPGCRRGADLGGRLHRDCSRRLASRTRFRTHGADWFNNCSCRLQAGDDRRAAATLVLIFAFQADNLIRNWLAVVLLAVPITIQVYFNSSLTYLVMRALKVPHNVASPGALIGASNFFELAVAVAITLFGPTSGAALATIVGVLVEVPVMLSVCRVCNDTRAWYARALPPASA
jgi:ACR3 family arsenite transporter